MGGSIDYVYRDGSRLTPWMLYVINRANAEFKAKFGCELLVTSGIRTNAEQTEIFLSKYRVQWTGNGPYGDVRWWKGKRYVRVIGGGTVAAPSKSNHEIQGTKAAADLRDSGRDAGVSKGNNPRADWLRANAARLGLVASGYGFGEPWHYDIPDIFRTPPSKPAGGSTTTSKEIKVKHYFNDDGKARRKGGVDLKPNASTWLKKDAKAASSQADNIVGGVGEYQFTVHVYAEGKPGDVVDLVLAWDNTKTKGAHSMHFVERIEIGADGFARRNVPFARAVATGYAVYARLATPAGNKEPVKVTRFAADALLFIAG